MTNIASETVQILSDPNIAASNAIRSIEKNEGTV